MVRPVRPVEHDARGIVLPTELLRRVSFDRHPPSAAVGRFVAWYWVIRWDLPDGCPHTQDVVAHPVVNLSFMAGGADVTGVQRGRQSRRLEGTGWVIGVMFRPAGFRPFLGAPMRSLTGAVMPLNEVFGPDAAELATAVAGLGPTAAARDAIDAFLDARCPAVRHAAEDTTELVEMVVDDRTITRVDQLSHRTGESPRQLQRRFSDHVGVSPKWVVRRYRIYEVAERAAGGESIDWAALAADLGYADQAHLSRDFTSAFGVAPGRYLERCRAARDADTGAVDQPRADAPAG